MCDLFAGINDGDKIRVEYGQFAVEGIWTRREGQRGWDGCLGTVEGNLGDHFKGHATCHHIYSYVGAKPVTRARMLQRALPPEPAFKAIVIDRAGWAWQRVARCTGEDWSRGFGETASWEQLNAAHGPVRVLWTPGDDK